MKKAMANVGRLKKEAEETGITIISQVGGLASKSASI